MSNPNRDALAELISGIAVALMEAGPSVVCSGDRVVIDCPAGLAEFAKALEARYLVVPRSDIVGTEYGWRFAELGMPEETWLAEDRSAAVGVVRSLQREQARDPIPRPGPQLLERPRLAWSVIPLPEDGDGVTTSTPHGFSAQPEDGEPR